MKKMILNILYIVYNNYRQYYIIDSIKQLKIYQVMINVKLNFIISIHYIFYTMILTDIMYVFFFFSFKIRILNNLFILFIQESALYHLMRLSIYHY